MEASVSLFEGDADMYAEKLASSNSSTSNRNNATIAAVLQEGKNEGVRRPESRNTSGLPGDHFNVLSADKAETLSIPPELIEPTAGSRRYLAKNQGKGAPTFAFYLCKMYTSNSTCAHGSFCDFIHSRHVLTNAPHRGGPVKAIQVHWSTPIHSMAEALYERHEPGSVFYINQSNFSGTSSQFTGDAPARLRLASDYVYKTRGSEEALLHGSTRLLRLCKHYEREKCGRGRICHFIHRVYLKPSTQSSMPPSLSSTETTATTMTAPFTYNQTADLNVINLRPSHTGTQPRFLPSANCSTNSMHGYTRQATGFPFDARGVPHATGGVIMSPPSMLSSQAPSPAQPPHLHLQQAQKQQQQQHPPIMTQQAGYPFSSVYTSQQTPYMSSTTVQISATQFQSSNSFYEQLHHRGTQHQNSTSGSQQQSALPVNSVTDYLLPQVLFTLM
ncbi:hypothetical protein TCSYLVIO_005337 [Trypanosoma cruzi]|uniref:C3H1-type domain-containing protein n=2 Tax=Trypanosoma cruzi TaxID=5693 RepID=V5DMD5_TRYCR|nr:hypothetical protein TCSYLVIO_005337 [Trypanosoma cruzi]ESS68556.1 hypothetical protein TCDM_02720 [Trypanosoma cruzi Dm28c]PBJ80250.1 Zinc finger protein, C3H1 type-like (ZC3H46) [Trypanosoma cruzi cruzi]PWU96006.1 Zinc finger protein, C3H1 type-like [Trypanosoma cruzi]RNF25415.1 hypothetical protein TcG_00030 [Trypanosoma cruzi]